MHIFMVVKRVKSRMFQGGGGGGGENVKYAYFCLHPTLKGNCGGT